MEKWRLPGGVRVGIAVLGVYVSIPGVPFATEGKTAAGTEALQDCYCCTVKEVFLS